MAMSRADRQRERAERAHLEATTGARRRCLFEGCLEYGRWDWHPSRAAALDAGTRHYRDFHYVRGGPPVARRG